MSTSATPPAGLPPAPGVEAYVRALFEGCAAALATLLSRSVAIDLEQPLHAPGEAVASFLPAPWFVCGARFTRGMAGAHDLLFAHDDARALARLVLNEEGPDTGVLSSDHEDALREMLSQMLSSVSSSLKLFLGRSTALALHELRHVETADGWTSHDAAIAVGQLLVEGVPRARIAVTVPSTVRDEVVALQAAGEASSATPVETPAGLELILDITMPITVELGRTRMLIRDILALGPGSVVELDKLAGEPVDLLINERAIAKGEVVVIDENFGVRLTQISQATDRIRSLA